MAAAGIIASRHSAEPAISSSFILKRAQSLHSSCRLPEQGLWKAHYKLEMLMVDG